MNVQSSALAGAACLALTGTASADLVGAKWVNVGDIGAGVNSFRIYLVFDDPLDQLLAVGGDADVSPLIFDSIVPLVQNNLFEGMSGFDDVPTVADLGGDSWVVISELEHGPHVQPAADHNTAFSPNFLGGDGMESVIKGTHFEQLDNGGYFDENPGTAALPDENMQILIAQFSLDLGIQQSCASYQGTASYNDGGGNLVSEAFFSAIPSPGALALFGVAAVAGRRRRR